MKKLHILSAFVLLFCFGRSRAQIDTLGVDTSFLSYSIPLTTSFNNIDSYVFNIYNATSHPFTGTIQVTVGVDTTNTAAMPLNTALSDSISVTIGPFGSVTDSISVTIDPSVYKPGINTVVIWPKNSSATPNAFATEDSLKVMVWVQGFAGLNETGPKRETIVFPNPMLDKLYIINRDISIERVRITNAEGQEIVDGDFKGYIDVSRFSSGTYLIEFSDSAGNTRRFKAIKE
jgi:hypothetical protein